MTSLWIARRMGFGGEHNQSSVALYYVICCLSVYCIGDSHTKYCVLFMRRKEVVLVACHCQGHINPCRGSKHLRLWCPIYK